MPNRPPPTWLTLLGLVLLALNLRAAIAGLAPLLPDIQRDLGFGRGTAGLLTTLPVLCFGLLAPAAALLGRRLGTPTALLLAMLAIAAGSGLRAIAGPGAMVAGTTVIGAGITVGNVLVPAVVKQGFPARQGLVSGLTTASLTGGAAIAAAIAAPLAYSIGLGWRGSLLALGGLAAVAAAGWLPQVRRRAGAAAPTGRPTAVLRSPVTWFLALFMGTQSMAYYGLLAWLPDLLRDQGVSAAGAGLALALFNLLGIGTALLAPILAGRRTDQRGLALATCAVWVVGLSGLLFAPALHPVWAVLTGLAQGASISLALTLIVLRAGSPAVARDLSGAVQTIGYLLGSTGPVLVGVLRDASGGWRAPLLALVGVIAAMAVASLGAARARPV
nr:MFS transporter [Micromonospora sp. DSM 115978]